jgi:hypothetical protein
MARKTTMIADTESPVDIDMTKVPVDVTQDPALDADPQPVGPKPASPSKLGFVAGVALGIVAAGAGYGVAQYYPITPVAGGTDMMAPLQAEIAALRDQIANLPAADDSLAPRLDRLEAAIQDAPDLGPITARLTALESKPDSAATILRLQEQIAALQAQSVPFDPMPAVQAAIAGELEAVRQSAANMRDQAQSAALAAVRTAKIALLQAALDTGAPYVSAAGLADMPSILTDHAETGLPSLNGLKNSFPDAARLALEAALRANMGGTWTERVTNFLRSQTGARALTPREGDDPDAILSRVEAALNTADLTRALAELQSLPSEAQIAMQDWTASAALRQAAIDAVSALAAKKE